MQVPPKQWLYWNFPTPFIDYLSNLQVPPKQWLYWNTGGTVTDANGNYVPPKQWLYWNSKYSIILSLPLTVPPKQWLYWNKIIDGLFVGMQMFHRNNGCIETQQGLAVSFALLLCSTETMVVLKPWTQKKMFTNGKFHRNNGCIETKHIDKILF